MIAGLLWVSDQVFALNFFRWWDSPWAFIYPFIWMGIWNRGEGIWRICLGLQSKTNCCVSKVERTSANFGVKSQADLTEERRLGHYIYRHHWNLSEVKPDNLVLIKNQYNLIVAFCYNVKLYNNEVLKSKLARLSRELITIFIRHKWKTKVWGSLQVNI